ncbi:hypothetical protein [Aldersonia kunmingensis]|uniref:hypothetical protein n=1 Tax=Aldersonia kunmingensis TaxID=408066 RepID=UPI0008341EAF|nr:hypothetical protein [Aldersonia kunmingensis]
MVYVSEFAAAGPLTCDIAENLSWKTGDFSSRIFLIVGGRRLLAQNLPHCWDELKVRTGTPITVTTEGGRHPADVEDRRALREFTDMFQRLTTC